jgi:murein DD-endopeptidase MepM/ murein hydrolase activator NlpD
MQLADSRVPDEAADYSRQLVECNGLGEAGFARWTFHPGMLFRAQEKWWGDWGRRPTPHEGIDLVLYTDEPGRLLELDESTRIPVMFDGEVVKIEKDYLGQSVYVDHGIDDGHGRRLWTMYGHTRPADHVRPGERVRRGEVIARLTKKKTKTTGPRPHLHLTMTWVSQERALGELRWETLHDPEIAVLFDPLHALGCPYRILDPDVLQGSR